MAIGSVVVGLLTLLAQPLGCCLLIVASVPLFIGGAVGLVLGLAAYRQAQNTNLAGFELAVVGVTLGAVNALCSMVWCGLSTLVGLMWAVAAWG